MSKSPGFPPHAPQYLPRFLSPHPHLRPATTIVPGRSPTTVVAVPLRRVHCQVHLTERVDSTTTYCWPTLHQHPECGASRPSHPHPLPHSRPRLTRTHGFHPPPKWKYRVVVGAPKLHRAVAVVVVQHHYSNPPRWCSVCFPCRPSTQPRPHPLPRPRRRRCSLPHRCHSPAAELYARVRVDLFHCTSCRAPPFQNRDAHVGATEG